MVAADDGTVTRGLGVCICAVLEIDVLGFEHGDLGFSSFSQRNKIQIIGKISKSIAGSNAVFQIGIDPGVIAEHKAYPDNRACLRRPAGREEANRHHGKRHRKLHDFPFHLLLHFYVSSMATTLTHLDWRAMIYEIFIYSRIFSGTIWLRALNRVNYNTKFDWISTAVLEFVRSKRIYIG
ncbi:hypothetical protein SDC9_161266 [bioreactor metagenome]|uniref:Uncharacterized protein n=1 Tax=bioreactor metagenome TaxID=1076179 RepID=A0A645FIZ9_9ZZZZ